MDIKQIKNTVARIKAVKGDYEVAHGMEDVLMLDFIRHVSQQTDCAALAAMAHEVLKTGSIDFARYTA